MASRKSGSIKGCEFRIYTLLSILLANLAVLLFSSSVPAGITCTDKLETINLKDTSDRTIRNFGKLHSIDSTSQIEQERLITLLSGLPEELIDFNNEEQFQAYFGELIHLLKQDPMQPIVKSHYDGMPESPNINDIKTHIHSPMSYLGVLSKIGADLRMKVLLKFKTDLSQLNVKNNIDPINNFNIKLNIPIVTGHNLTSHQMHAIREMATTTIHEMYLKKAGFKRPVTFTGYVPGHVANEYAKSSLFLDDPLISGLVSHGRFTHVLTAASLIDAFNMDQTWFAALVDTNNWIRLLDEGNVINYKETYKIKCTLDDNSELIRSWDFNTYPDGHNPSVVNLWLMNGYFSNLIDYTLTKPEAAQVLAGRLGASKKQLESSFSTRKFLENTLQDVRAFENMVALDLNNDIGLLWDYRSYTEWPCYVKCPQLLVYPASQYSVFSHLGLSSAGYLSDRGYCSSFHNLVMDQMEASSKDEFIKRAYKHLLPMNEEVIGFSSCISEGFKPARKAWLEDNNIPFATDYLGGDYIPPYLMYFLENKDFIPYFIYPVQH